jgi:hypothetical protein
MVKGNLQIRWIAEVKDKNGKVTFQKSGISKSLLRNFMYWFQGKFQLTALGQSSTWTAPDTTNTARTFVFPTGTIYEGAYGFFGGLAANSSFGLRVGLLNTAVAPTDYEMASLISHGVGSDQMSYGAQTYEAVTVVGQNTSFRISRPFTNSSGVTITVKEIGAVFSLYDASTVARYLCYLRDVLPSSVPVPDGSTFTLRYTFTVTA